MHTKDVRIHSKDYELIKDIIINNREPDNIINFEQGSQIAFEKHSFLNSNNYLIIVLIIKHDKYTNISFTAGGASTGTLIKFDWGTEKGSIKKLWEDIELWCESNDIEFEVLDEIK